MRFNDIPGNDVIKKKLIQTVVDQRVSHAQLFYGPEDSQKLALSVAYAQLINCQSPIPFLLKPPGQETNPPDQKPHQWIDSCGVCPSCVQIQKLVHPDLHFIFPNNTTKKVTSKPSSKQFLPEFRNFLLETNFSGSLNQWYETLGIENKQGTINVRDAEEIIHTLSYKSYESEYKIVIIWMVEKLYHAIASKLLKILEEPPEKTLFLLISDQPGQVISTILSRCFMVRIPGSPLHGTGNSLISPGESDGALSHFQTFRQWMRICYSKNVPGIINFSNDISKIGRERQKSLLSYGLKISGYFPASTYGLEALIPLTGEELDFVKKFSPFLPEDRLQQFATLLNQAIYHLERNAQASLLFLNLSLNLVRIVKGETVISVER